MHVNSWNDFQVATTFGLTATQTAQTLTNMVTKFSAAVQAFCTVDTAPVRYGLGGLVAKATTGHRVDKDANFSLFGWDEMNTFQYVRDGGTNGKIWCTIKYPNGSHPARS